MTGPVLPPSPSVRDSEQGSTRRLSSAWSPPLLSCWQEPGSLPAPSRCVFPSRPRCRGGRSPRKRQRGSLLRSHPSAHCSSLPTGALCGPLWEQRCCRGEERPGDLQQMAPDRGDGGRSASAGIPAEPQVTHRRVPSSPGRLRLHHHIHYTPLPSTLTGAGGQPLRLPGERPAPRSFLPCAASSFYRSPSYLLFRCVLKALRPMQHFSQQLPALGRSRQAGGALARRCPSPAGSPRSL